jgi:serine/threonine-protein kinase
MEHKVFLGKYRIAPDEIALATAEPANASAAVAMERTGRTYHGEEIDSGRDVTVEVVPAASVKPAVRAKLEEEAAEARQINHINIPALYDFGIQDGQLVYVTEYFDGTSTEEWVNAHGPMPTGAALRIALQVMGAMGAAAFRKISHHAINPGNLMLVPGQTPEGDWPLVKVLHFIGVAPAFVGGDMSVAAFDKSTHYASPEQLQGGAVDFRSEIYSLGATMWFLLTGAPPLIAPKGPLATQPATIGLAVDKLKGMPKRMRRLLAQMLSVDPAGRPQDALAVYRQIQDCAAQLERRESMARRFGVPFVSGRNSTSLLPGRRRFLTKMVALAAVVIMLVTVASVSLATYLRHQRVRQAEEPIGVPIGVPDANASAAPVIASAPTVAPAPPRPLPENTAPVTKAAESPPPVVAESTPVVTQSPPATAEPAPMVAADSPSPSPDRSETTAPAANNFPAKEPRVAANEEKSVEENPHLSQPKEVVNRAAGDEKPDRPTEIAIGKAASPDVRRAEPAPPSEGPDEVAATPEKTVAPSTKVKKAVVKRTKREFNEESIPRAEPADEEEVFPSQAPQVQQLPRGRIRAKFIGVTADGNWMFSLPNKKIVIVPPPPGG